MVVNAGQSAVRVAVDHVERLPIEGGLELPVLRQEAGRQHEMLDPRSRAAVAIAWVTDLAVMAVA